MEEEHALSAEGKENAGLSTPAPLFPVPATPASAAPASGWQHMQSLETDEGKPPAAWPPQAQISHAHFPYSHGYVRAAWHGKDVSFLRCRGLPGWFHLLLSDLARQERAIDFSSMRSCTTWHASDCDLPVDLHKPPQSTQKDEALLVPVNTCQLRYDGLNNSNYDEAEAACTKYTIISGTTLLQGASKRKRQQIGWMMEACL